MNRILKISQVPEKFTVVIFILKNKFIYRSNFMSYFRKLNYIKLAPKYRGQAPLLGEILDTLLQGFA